MNKEKMLTELFGEIEVTEDSIMSEARQIFKYQESVGNPYSMHVAFEFATKELEKLKQRQETRPHETIVNGRPINVYDLVTHLRHQKEWSATAFGPAEKVDRTEGIFDHMQKEIEEAREKPHDIEEWIDIAMLAFDGAWRNGATPEEIAGVLFEKLQKNRNREWPDWTKADPNKAIEHNGH